MTGTWRVPPDHHANRPPADPWLKVTSVVDQDHRIADRPAARGLLELYARHGVRTATVLRASDAFGPGGASHDGDIDVLALDPPMVATAIGPQEQVEGVVTALETEQPDGLVTVERLQPVRPALAAGRLTRERVSLRLTERTGSELKLTAHLDMAELATDGRPGSRAVVEELRRLGARAAVVYAGLEGIVDGEERRPHLLHRTSLPACVEGVGDVPSITAAAELVSSLVPAALCTAEHVDVLRCDGDEMRRPAEIPDTDEDGRPLHRVVRVWSGFDDAVAGRPLHQELVRELHAAGATGATAVPTIWGFRGDAEPGGDHRWTVGRAVPVVTTLLERPSRMAELLPVVERVTADRGLVCAEVVPAARWSGGGAGSLALAAARRGS